MAKIKKRVAAAALSLFMVVTLFPVNAQAAKTKVREGDFAFTLNDGWCRDKASAGTADRYTSKAHTGASIVFYTLDSESFNYTEGGFKTLISISSAEMSEPEITTGTKTDGRRTMSAKCTASDGTAVSYYLIDGINSATFVIERAENSSDISTMNSMVKTGKCMVANPKYKYSVKRIFEFYNSGIDIKNLKVKGRAASVTKKYVNLTQSGKTIRVYTAQAGTYQKGETYTFTIKSIKSHTTKKLEVNA